MSNGELAAKSRIESADLNRSALDAIHLRMCGGQAFEAMDELVSRLHRLYVSMSNECWKIYVGSTLMQHAIREVLHGDPFTHRAFSKPRGYAGDAVMIDMIYSVERIDTKSHHVDNEVFRYTVDGSAPRAVRNRRRLLARLIDETIGRRPDARILVLAAGHLRELDLTKTFGNSFRGEIVALDQDAESLAVIEDDYACRGVRTMHTSIRQVLSDKLDLRGFDLVYAAGLFDYLPQPVAKALCEKMFAMLNPGGHLLAANFVPRIPDVGYMESFMDWHLVYRDETAMRELASALPRDQLAGIDLSFDGTQNIVYLTVVRVQQLCSFSRVCFA